MRYIANCPYCGKEYDLQIDIGRPPRESYCSICDRNYGIDGLSSMVFKTLAIPRSMSLEDKAKVLFYKSTKGEQHEDNRRVCIEWRL